MITQEKLTTEETVERGNSDKTNISFCFSLIRKQHQQKLQNWKLGNKEEKTTEMARTQEARYVIQKDKDNPEHNQEQIYRLSIRLIPITILLFNNFAMLNPSFYLGIPPMIQHAQEVQQRG